MSGFSEITVLLEDEAGEFTHDITSRVDLREGWDFSRGRRDEFATPDPGQAHLTVDNSDGAFTLGAPGYGSIRVDQRIRIIESVGEVTGNRFTGYVQDWPYEVTDPRAKLVPSRLTLIDRLSRFNRRKLRDALVGAVISEGALAVWPLQEPAGSSEAFDVAPPLPDHRLVPAGSGGSPVFGVAAEVDGFATGVEFAGGKYLVSSGGYAVTDAAVLELYLIINAAPATDATICNINSYPASGWLKRTGVFLTPAGKIRGGLSGGESDVVAGTGNVVHVVLECASAGLPSGTGGKVWVDGELISSESFDGGVGTLGINVGVGGPGAPSQSIAPLDDVVVLMAAFHSGQVGAEVAARPISGMPSERSDERIARLAALGGMDPAELDLEEGVQTVPAQDLDGVRLGAAIDDVVLAEGGLRFIDGSGNLATYNRHHRVYAAAGEPAVTLSAADVQERDLLISADKQFLQNEVSGTRVGGATVVAIDDVSQQRYDQYENDLGQLLVETDEQVRDRVRWQVHTYSEPRARLAQVTIDLLTVPTELAEQLLALELGDRVVVTDLPETSPTGPTADLLVDHITERQSRGGNSSEWTLTLGTTPAELAHGWILDDPVFSVLDDTTQLTY